MHSWAWGIRGFKDFKGCMRLFLAHFHPFETLSYKCYKLGLVYTYLVHLWCMENSVSHNLG